MPTQADADIILVGAGLASALVAARLSAEPKPPSIFMLERGAQPFAGHTWSFHQADITPAAHRWVAPMVAHRWAAHSVRFAKFTRRIDSAYLSLTSESVGAFIQALPNVTIRTGADVASVESHAARFSDGTLLHAPCVIDARGFQPDPALKLGFQKFVGLEVETAGPHGLHEPVLMDATVPQLDGYRFIYCLPFSPNRLLIEDTRYADEPDLDRSGFAEGIEQYAKNNGWTIRRVLREEQGCLPIALAFDSEAFWRNRPAEVPTIGLRAGLFHATTGYSLPEAVQVADLVARHWREGSALLAGTIRAHAIRRASEQRFYRLLNRMLFKAARPEERHWVLQRFYGLPQPLIENFYAGRTTLADKVRILSGRPPVPITRALRCLSERGALEQAA